MSTSTSQIDDLCLAVANGDTSVMPTFLGLLEAERPRLFTLWMPDRREAWGNGLELILEQTRGKAPGAADFDLLEALLQVGYDSEAFRARLATGARARFRDYSDPVGMLNALGVTDRAVSISRLSRRWQVMQALAVGVTCHHPSLGNGTISEIDGLANQIHIQFAQRRTVPLDQALDLLVLVKAGSPLDQLLRKTSTLPASVGADQVRQQTAASIIPKLPCTDDLMRQLHVPVILSESEFQALLAGTRGGGAVSKVVAPGKDRQWFQSRNLEELSDLLAKAGTIATPAREQLAAVQELYNRFGMKKEQGAFAAQAAAQLWVLTNGVAEVRELLHEIVPVTKPWNDKELFVEIADAMPGKTVPEWFEVTGAACGVEWLCEAATGLPFRLFAPLAKVLAKFDDGAETFLDDVVARVQRQNPTPDLLLWLWKSKRPEREIMADPGLVFKTLGKPVRGSYIKANKELRKLLLDDEAFQKFVMLDGDTEAIASMVSCVRHVPLLDSGEQQSLLVKIVRVFPAARALVEQSARGNGGSTTAVRRLDHITSIRSYELLRRELNDIINVKIPENSKAIAQARSYGDLRENAEFKSAKENQRLLRLRRNELERTVHDVKAFDFSGVVVADRAIPGSVVTLRLADGRTDSYTVLGLRDGDPDKKRISYDSPLGKALTGSNKGETVTLPNGDSAEITGINPLSAELLAWLQGDDLV